jgi:hypothetical protein
VFDSEPHMQTVEAMELITAKIVELRAGLAEGCTAITAPPSLFYDRACGKSLYM